MSEMLATKPIDSLMREAGEEREGGLRRVLGPVNLVTLGIGAIIGAGIFVLTGTVAANFTGPAIILSFMLAGIGCVFAGLCYAEFASLIPIAGSAYTYAYATLGEIFAWIIGWDLVIEYAFGAATVAAGWSGNLVALFQSFGIEIPPALTAPPGMTLVFYQGIWVRLATIGPALQQAGIDPLTLPHARGIIDLPAYLVIAIITAILVFGIRESANFNSAIVLVKVATVLTFIAVVAAYLLRHPSPAASNWHPFIPPNQGQFGSFGWSGVARGAGVIFFAYIGFDAVSTAAQEAKDPERDMPIGFRGSIGTLLALVIVSAGVWILRVRRPDLPRPFKAPFVPLTPILGMGISFALMATLPWRPWLRLIVWLILGMGIYFGYGRKHSVLAPARAAAK